MLACPGKRAARNARNGACADAMSSRKDDRAQPQGDKIGAPKTRPLWRTEAVDHSRTATGGRPGLCQAVGAGVSVLEVSGDVEPVEPKESILPVPASDCAG